MVVQAKKRGDGISFLQKKAIKLMAVSKLEIYLCHSVFLCHEGFVLPFREESIQKREKDKSSFIKKPQEFSFK